MFAVSPVGLDQGVVRRRAAGDGEATGGDRYRAARVRRDEGGGRCVGGEVHRVAGDQTERRRRSDVQGVRGGGVVDLVQRIDIGHIERRLGDGSRPGGGRWQDVVGQVRGACRRQVHTVEAGRDRDARSRPGARVGAQDRPGKRDAVAAHETGEEERAATGISPEVHPREHRAGGIVVDLGRIVDDRGDDRRGGDRARAVDHGRQNVVAGRALGEIEVARQQTDRDGLDARVRRAVDAGGLGDRGVVSTLKAGKTEVGGRQPGQRRRAVKDLGRVADDYAIDVVSRAGAPECQRRGIDQANAGSDRRKAVVRQRGAGVRAEKSGDGRRDAFRAGVRRGIGPGRLDDGGALSGDETLQLVVGDA